MPSNGQWKFGIKVDESWGFSIGVCFSVTPELQDGKKERYLFINLGKISISIGYMLMYPKYDGEIGDDE